MTHLSLFSGIGGLDLAAEWAGFETVGQCEWADYPTKVLEKHWPGVPRWRDIRTLTGKGFYERTGLRTVDVISGGFPCQPFSVAGKQRGHDDERYLWPEMLRVIRELKPHYVIGENVPGILNIEADDVCTGLECEGYEVRIFDFEAAAVGAQHRRERCFFVANFTLENASSCRCEQSRVLPEQPWGAKSICTGKSISDRRSAALREDVANTDKQRLQTSLHGGDCRKQTSKPQDNGSQVKGNGNRGASTRCCFESGLGRMADGISNWLVEPDIPRVATGIKNRVDRLKCLGNAVVPQQAYPIFKAIADYERERYVIQP